MPDSLTRCVQIINVIAWWKATKAVIDDDSPLTEKDGKN